MAWEAWYTLGVVIVLIGVLATERLSPPVAVVGAVAALVVPGVIDSRAALSGFSNEAPVTIAALYVCAAGVEATGGLGAVSRLLLPRRRPGAEGATRAEMLQMGTVASLCSAFVYNTPTTALLAPRVASWAQRGGSRPSRYLLPLNIAILAGGLLTAIGTTTNVVISGLLAGTHRPELSLFEPLPVALPIALAVIALLVLIGPALVPSRKAPGDSFADARRYTVEMTVRPGGELAGKTIAEAGLRHLDGVYLVEVAHDGITYSPAGPDVRLHDGDRLVFTGNVGRVVDLHAMAGLAPADEPQFSVGPGPQRRFYQAVIGPTSPLAGTTLRETGFRAHYDAAVVAVHRSGDTVSGKLGDVVLRPGDVLLVLGSPEFRDRFGGTSDFALVATPDGAPAPPRTEKAMVVNLIMAGFLLAIISGLMSVLAASFAAAALIVGLRVLRPWEARQAIDLNVLVVLCGSFAVGAAVASSGLAKAIAGLLIVALHGFGAVGILAGVLIATVAITQVVTNNAAAVLMYPIAMATASQAHLDYRAFVIALVVGASASFMTPIGYQTNMMVYGMGGYRWSDFLKLGAPVTVVVTAVALVAISVVYHL